MKIYAGYTDYLELAEYVGQDAWIRCDGPRGPEYVRVVAKSNNLGWDFQYTVNLLSPEKRVALDTIATFDVALGYLTATYTVKLSEFDIHEPKEILTTKQLYPDYDADLTKFDKYINKNVWVLAEEYGGYVYYIMPIRRENNILYSRNVVPEYLDGRWSIDFDDPQAWADYVQSDKLSVTPVDSWKIITPTEIVTTSDILDAFDQYRTVDEGEE